AQPYDPARDGDRAGGGEVGLRERGETAVDLGRCVIRTEVVRVRVDALLPKRLQLFPSDHDLLVVVGHAAEVSKDARVYWLRPAASNVGTASSPSLDHGDRVRRARAAQVDG